MSYEQKYLKYKQKYLDLKEKIGGGHKFVNAVINGDIATVRNKLTIAHGLPFPHKANPNQIDPTTNKTVLILALEKLQLNFREETLGIVNLLLEQPTIDVNIYCNKDVSVDYKCMPLFIIINFILKRYVNSPNDIIYLMPIYKTILEKTNQFNIKTIWPRRLKNIIDVSRFPQKEKEELISDLNKRII